MATSLDTGVPWVMCQQKDAPSPIVSSVITISIDFKAELVIEANELCFSF